MMIRTIQCFIPKHINLSSTAAQKMALMVRHFLHFCYYTHITHNMWVFYQINNCIVLLLYVATNSLKMQIQKYYHFKVAQFEGS
jgi:hypothetical protein